MKQIILATTNQEEENKTTPHFISVVAHRLRTQLSIIKWALGMLSSCEDRLTVEQLDLLQKSAAANELMIRLIDDLIEVARIEEGRMNYIFEKTDLAALLENLCKSFEAQAIAKGLYFTFHKPGSLVQLTLDSDRISIALRNIIENAVLYTFKGGVNVRIEQNVTGVRIIVSDTGIGVPNHQISQLFSQFFRGDNVLRLQIDGTGLGLFIARSIIKSHGGDITVSSKENDGTIVTISLPIDPNRIPRAEVPIEEIVS